MARQSERTNVTGLDDEVKRNHRWNFTTLLLDWFFFVVAISFASVNTILPVFARRLTSSSFLIGLVPALSALGLYLPQILTANFIEKLKRNKDFIMLVTVGERVPWLILFLGVIFLPPQSPLMLPAFLLLYAVIAFSGGIATPAWQDMLAKLISVRRRGRFFGWSNFLAGGGGIAAAFLSVHLLNRFPYPRNFSLCFLFAFIFTSVSWIFLGLVREPTDSRKGKKSTLKDYLRRLPILLRKDKNFLSFLVSNALLSCSGMATAFFAVHAINKLALPDSQIGVFTLLLLSGQTVSSVIWGYLGDRKGYKMVMELGSVLTILSIILALFSSTVYLFYAVFFVFGWALSAQLISGMGLVLEFSKPETRPTYIASANTVRAPFMALSPLLGGFLADRISFPFVFVLTILVLLGGISYLALLVKEPRHLPPFLPGSYLPKRRP